MWDYILDFYEGKIACDDYYDVRKCHEDPEETNYRTWCRLDQTRKAIHVGGLDFMGLQSETYDALIPDIMQSKREEIGGLLEDYPVCTYIYIYSSTRLSCQNAFACMCAYHRIW